MDVQDIMSNAVEYADRFWNDLAASIATMSRPEWIPEDDWSKIQAAEAAHHARCGRVNAREYFGVRFVPGFVFEEYIATHPSYEGIAQAATRALSTRGAAVTPQTVVPLVKCPFIIDDNRHSGERRLRREFPEVSVEDVDNFERALIVILNECTTHVGKGYANAFAEGARHVGYRVLGAGAATDFKYPFAHLSPANVVDDAFETWAKANNIPLNM